MWVCLIWWMGCGLLNFIIDLVDVGLFGLVSLVVFFFFFEMALVAVGVCAGGGCW